MAEIKSTLDLVMERTRHMTLSEDEKREQAMAEVNGILNGWIQKFLDGTLTLDRFEEEFERLRETSAHAGVKALIQAAGARLDPASDNEKILALLARTCRVDTRGVASALDDYRSAKANMAADMIGRIKDHLLKTRGISGSAVVPNLESHKNGIGDLDQGIRERAEQALRREVAAWTASAAS